MKMEAVYALVVALIIRLSSVRAYIYKNIFIRGRIKMGFNIYPYSPAEWPELKIQAYVCLDMYNPVSLHRNFQDTTQYDISSNFRVYKSKNDRLTSPHSSVQLFSVSKQGINPSDNLCGVSYEIAKQRFLSIPDVVITDD